MRTSELRKRLIRDRPMIEVSLRMPEDVVTDLERIAPLLGFSGCQPLIRAYVGQGLRADLERLEGTAKMIDFVESLKRHGIDDAVISEAMAEVDIGADIRHPNQKEQKNCPRY